MGSRCRVGYLVNEMDFTSLMSRYCDGDASAFRELYLGVAPRLLDHLAATFPDRAYAEALLQSTFLRFHRGRRAYVRGRDPVPWLFAIADDVAIDAAKNAAKG